MVKENNISAVLDAAASKKRVSGFTHDFYNYPARFSPLLAREIIKSFSQPGDLVLDPFMGGGTTLVEAKVLGRHAIGFDISSLSSFLLSVKLNPLPKNRFSFYSNWVRTTLLELNCHKDVKRPTEWISKGYQRNLSNKQTWPIRKVIEQFLESLDGATNDELEKNFMRCVLLKTSQWALDSKKVIPNVQQFKLKLIENFESMIEGAEDFWSSSNNSLTLTINKPADCIHNHTELFINRQPKLVLTSPPYPGIHVVYHRWQVFGKRETPAPFWIANSLDGHGLSHYAMGDRKQKGLSTYFSNIKNSFASVRKVCNDDTIVIQVLAFSDIKWQLPKYLRTMEEAGFVEFIPNEQRIWRDVPNRKWYAHQKGRTSSSQEVILFHKTM